MRAPRFRIAWLMAVIAIVALNFGVMAQWSYDSPEDETIQTLIAGGLPMANVLAVGLLFGRRRLRNHPFLLGFVVFGVTVLALYVIATTVLTGAWIEPYLLPVLERILGSSGLTMTPARVLTLVSVVVAMLGLPQVAFAVVGGLLFRRLRIAERPDGCACTQRRTAFPPHS
jgi:hypothetical protein